MGRNLREYFSTPKGRAYLALFGFGILFLILGVLAAAFTAAPTTAAAAKTAPIDPVHNRGLRALLILMLGSPQVPAILISIGGSLVVLSAVEIIFKVGEIYRADLSLFKDFFGTAALSTDGYLAVFLEAETAEWLEEKDKADQPKTDAGLNNVRIPHPPRNAIGTWPKGIKHIIAFEDLDAVIRIDVEFRKFGGKLHVIVDEYSDHVRTRLPKGCLSIGLGYNNVTSRLADLSKGLFEIGYTKTQYPSDYVGWKENDAAPYKEFQPNDGDDYALIARVLNCKEQPPAPCIICAGHTATGTVVASEYLADHWDVLANLYLNQHPRPKKFEEHNMAVLLLYKKNEPNDVPRVGPTRFTKATSDGD